MLFPKKVKHRKWQTTRRNPKRSFVATRGTKLSYGSFGIKSLDAHRITSNQIEAARRVVRRAIGKNGSLWMRIFPDRPYTAKAAEVGMGKGKGDPKGFVAQVEPGRVVLEVDGVSEAIAREALRRGAAKLPVHVTIIARE